MQKQTQKKMHEQSDIDFSLTRHVKSDQNTERDRREIETESERERAKEREEGRMCMSHTVGQVTTNHSKRRRKLGGS